MLAMFPQLNGTASFLRYTDDAESAYLQKIAKTDAWNNVNQWLVPSLALATFVIVYWFSRKKLEILLYGNPANSNELFTFIHIAIQFFIALLHIVLLAYLVKLVRILGYFRKSSENVQTAGEPEIHQLNDYVIYRIAACPDMALSLVLTSRSGVRRYRWHYYLDEVPITPLPQQRKLLPLYVQKKSWEKLSEYNLEQLARVFPDESLVETLPRI